MKLTHLSTQITGPGFVGLELLSDDSEVRLVGGQAQHDQVSVGPAEDVVGVRVVVGLGALTTDEIHEFVLALTLKFKF